MTHEGESEKYKVFEREIYGERKGGDRKIYGLQADS